jgi:hypothetical protein
MMWFLVPVDPMGPTRADLIGKGEPALIGILLAATLLIASRYCFKKSHSSQFAKDRI